MALLKLRPITGVILVAMFMTGCAGDEPSGLATAAQPSVVGEGRIAASPQWAAEGERLRQEKKEAAQARAAANQPVAGNSADFAFQTQPVDITGNGAYTLRAEVPPGFDYPNSPKVVSVNYPPDNGFTIGPAGMKVVTTQGRRELEFNVVVTDFTAPYKAYSVWLY